MEIQYFNRRKGILEVEKVYGEKGIKWLYETSLGGKLANFLAGDSITNVANYMLQIATNHCSKQTWNICNY